ncbi:hypothetical protein HOG75_01570 [bacterium]|nr:hypothetical protein [bacterium]
MNKVFKLIKLSWHVKSNIWKCLKFDKTTDEYCLAKYYEDALNELDNTTEKIEVLILKTQKLQNKFRDREELNNLLSSVIVFLNQLKLTEN